MDSVDCGSVGFYVVWECFVVCFEVVCAGGGAWGVCPFTPDFPSPKRFGYLCLLFRAGDGWVGGIAAEYVDGFRRGGEEGCNVISGAPAFGGGFSKRVLFEGATRVKLRDSSIP